MADNPYQSGQQKVVPAVLVYVWRTLPSGERQVLMIHRIGRDGDFHAGKWNGLGGKLELSESPWQSAARELCEESGLQLNPDRFRWQGTLQFPNFKPQKNEDWWCAVLTAEVSEAEASAVADGSRFTDEGELHWVSEGSLLSLNLWEGDRQFIPAVLAGHPFQGTIWYDGGTVRGFDIRVMDSR